MRVYPPNGEPFYSLPRGAHGKGSRAEIENGHIKRMARQFRVLNELRKQLPGL